MNNSVREQLITLVVVLALGGGFVFAGLLPRSRTLAGIRKESQSLQQQNEVALGTVEDVGRLHLDLEALRSDLRSTQNRIPTEDHFAEFENTILQLGETQGLWNSATEPRIVDTTGVSKPGSDGLLSRSMKFAFTADFERFFEFLLVLESQEKLTAVEAIEIEPDPRNPRSDQFQIAMEVRIFHGHL